MCKNSRRGVPVPQMGRDFFPAGFGLVRLANQGREDVRGMEVEIVIRAVEIGGHGGDEVFSVFSRIGLAELDARDFGEGVGIVGGLESARQQ